MRVSLAVIPLMLPIFSTDFSRSSSELSALKAASMSNAPGMTCASAKFGMVFSFRRIVAKLPLTFNRANASGLSQSASLELLEMLSKEPSNALQFDDEDSQFSGILYLRISV